MVHRVWVLVSAVFLWVGVVFFPIATLRAINIQDDIFASDLLNDRLPARAFVGESLRRGELPLWSSEIYTGFPMLAQVEVGALYPSNALLFGVFPPYVAIAYAQLLPLVFVGIGTGLLVLELGLPLASAILAGGSLALSGFFVCHIRQLNLIDAACWLPLILLVVERAARGSRRVVVAMAVVWGLSLLAGHPQVSYYTALVVAPYALVRFHQVDRASGERPLRSLAGLPADPRLWRIAAGVAIGTLIAAMPLVPAFELASLGHRKGGVPYEMAAAFPVSPWALLSFFDAYANGDASNLTFGLSGIFWEQYGYLGLLPALLAILALVLEWRDPRVRLLGVLVFFSGAMMLGPNTGLFPLAFDLVPGMSYFRFPARFLLFVEIGVTLLSAFGFARLIRAAATPAARAVLVLLVLGATAADLWIHQRRQVPLVPWEEWTKPIETVEILRSARESSPLAPPRYHALDAKHVHAQVHHFSRGWSGDLSQYVAIRDYLQPSFNLLFDLPSVDGYANLVPTPYERIWGSEKATGLVVPSGRMAGGDWVLAPHVVPLLELFGVRFLLSAWPLASDEVRRVAATSEGIQIYELPDALPRAFVVGRVRAVASDEEAVDVLRSGDLLPDEEAIVLAGAVDLAPGARPSREVRIVERAATVLEVEAALGAPGLLVVSESFYPGWRASVDGREATIHRANVMMRAVALEAGTHRVRFEYAPASVRLGFTLSLVGLVSLAGAAYLERRAARVG